ncbi:MAG: ribosome maturation factor RimP [Clostridia bacterium]
MAKNIKTEVEEFISPIVSSLGYEIVEVDFGKKSNGNNLTVFIDKIGGISLDDCEIVHKAIDGPLDELNPTSDEPYTLNVSSSGLDRPIVSDKDLERNIGELLELSLFQKIDKKKEFIAVLKCYDADNLTFIVENHDLSVKRTQVAKLVKHIEI